MVVNTFRRLETEYCDQFEKTHASQAYFVGPVSLSHTLDMDGVIERGGKGDTSYLRWLDNKDARSVILSASVVSATSNRHDSMS
jgi:hypothetical protein